MRTILLAASILAALAALAALAVPAAAGSRHRSRAADDADFVALATSQSPTSRPVQGGFARSYDPTSPNLNNFRFCVWGALGDC